MKYLTLMLYVCAAWIVHATLVFIYLPYFSSTHSILFRLTHVIDIGAVMTIAFRLFFKHHGKMTRVHMLLTSLGTLAVIDLLLFKVLAPTLTSFDIWHVVAAFLTVAISAILASEPGGRIGLPT